METTPLRQQFEADGFVYIKGLLEPMLLDKVRKAVEQYVSDVVPGLPSTQVMYELRDGVREIKMLSSLHKSDSFFADLIQMPKIKNLAKELLDDDVVINGVEYFDKPPKIGTPTPPHQDGYYFCLTPNEAITLWIPLDDCDEENGCLGYVKGSHRMGVIDHSPSGVVGFSQGVKKEIWNKKDVATYPVKAGDCLAHHSLTVHFAGPNRSPNRHRRSLGLIYYAAKAKKDEDAQARYEASLAEQRRNYAEGSLNITK